MKMSRKIFSMLVVLGLLLLYVGSRVKVVELGYAVSKLKSRTGEMARANSLLKSKVAQMKSTARLDEWATRLGMASPGTEQVLFLKAEGGQE